MNFDIARSKLKLCAEAGVLKHGFSKESGGYGDGFKALCQVHEFIAQNTLDPGLNLSLNAHIWGGIFPLIYFGSNDQRSQWLPDLLEGKIISGHAITEPNVGSDVKNMSTRVEIFNNGFLINGHKRYISNAPIADCLIIYARDDHRISAFIVKKTDKGAFFTDNPKVIGFKTAPIGDVILDKCFVPRDRLLGQSGAGMIMIQSVLSHERVFLFAGLLGIMKYQLDHVIHRVRNRKINGQSLGKNQSISHKIADMSIRLETTRLWIYHCARLADQHKKITFPSSHSKIYASESFLQSSLDAIQIMGAKGLEPSQELSQFVIDAIACRLLSGSTEIQKNIISGLLGIGEGY
ncbi:MAG: acyl-CoA dehydrogenase [Neisseriaceae bacterium]|nr:MAG: acyl-CoA dehydrogenase [Neisseriaceae bacterium]